ncbi:hypothetical protein R1sor_026245 [Riccia sorocarpa]|uniref:Leucine-rich repeat-containing N-terminal plant-type domain-containing protein n=1 Tax=Riccia sorocarpa TaxID=122646 RepID=A0ABD3GDP0_9MARC
MSVRLAIPVLATTLEQESLRYFETAYGSICPACYLRDSVRQRQWIFSRIVPVFSSSPHLIQWNPALLFNLIQASEMASSRFLVLMLVLSVAAEMGYAQTCSDTDNAGLLYFSREIAVSGSAFATWVEGTNCCGWAGVVCDSSGRVTSLVVNNTDIPNVAPSGQDYVIASALGNLDSLTELKIVNIGLFGNISPIIGTLSRLQTMYIDGCNLEGAIPPSYCNLGSLTTFVMKNMLLSSYPDCFNNKPSITTIDLTGNKFTGAPKRP